MQNPEENPFGPASLDAVRAARLEAATPRGLLERFTGPGARLVPAGNAAPGLLRSAMAAVERRPAMLAKDRESLGGLAKFVDGAVAIPAGAARGPSPLLSLAVRLATVGAVAAFSIAFTDAKAQARDHGYGGRPQQPGLAQQIQVPQRPQFGQGGGWNRPAPQYNNGGNAGYGNAIQAWRERREIRREERQDRNTALLATGAVIAGALIGNQAYNRNYGGGYGAPYGGYGAYAPPPRPDPYLAGGAYGAYGEPRGYGGYGGYAPNPRVPSDGFVLEAKKLIAAQLRDVQAADRIIDNAIYQGVACVRQMGPGASCTARTHEVSLDFVRGVFTASIKGIPVIEEVNGYTNRLRPDILDEAYRRAMDAHVDNLGDGYGGRRPGM